MSRFDNLNSARMLVECPDEQGNVLPSRDGLAITRTIDAGFRDLIDAIGEASNALTSDDRLHDLKTRAKAQHRVLHGFRSGVVTVATRLDKIAKDGDDPVMREAADALAELVELTTEGATA